MSRSSSKHQPRRSPHELDHSNATQACAGTVWCMSDIDSDQDGSVSAQERLNFWQRRWAATPVVVRRTIVAFIGGTLVLLGIALVVLPGPFTLPLLIAGFAVLATEFAWAHRALETGRARAKRAAARVARRK
jgi:hypothetical protein